MINEEKARELIEKLRWTPSRSKREMLDAAANMIEELLNSREAANDAVNV